MEYLVIALLAAFALAGMFGERTKERGDLMFPDERKG
jgi:hypothetical protein